MTTTEAHLQRILEQSVEIIANEAMNCDSLTTLYPEIGPLHPADAREAHIRSLLFTGLRSAGYHTRAESNYFDAASPARRVDLVVWLPDVRRWFFLEIEPCGPLYGFLGVLEDARKLIDDNTADSRNALRGLFVYGFRDKVGRDSFAEKYQRLSKELEALGFREFGVKKRTLDGDAFLYVQAGLWMVGDTAGDQS